MIPGRMALLVTLFLVVINIFINLTDNSPVSKGFNAASAWVFSCLIFVFGTLVAYAGILLKKKTRLRAIKVSLIPARVKLEIVHIYIYILNTQSILYFGSIIIYSQILFQMKQKTILTFVDDDTPPSWENVDSVFLIVFPILFLLFNLVCWTIFVVCYTP